MRNIRRAGFGSTWRLVDLRRLTSALFSVSSAESLTEGSGLLLTEAETTLMQTLRPTIQSKGPFGKRLGVARALTTIIFVSYIHTLASILSRVNYIPHGGGRPKRNIDGQRVLIKSPCSERHISCSR